MGLFGRARRAAHITPDQMRIAAASLPEWERAESVTEWQRAASSLAAQGGWDWWLRLARQAQASGDARLVGQINCFVAQFKAVLGNTSGLPVATRAVRRELDEVTVKALQGAPADMMIQNGSAGEIDVEKLLGWVTLRLQEDLY